MTSISAVNYGYPQNYFNNVPPSAQAMTNIPAMISKSNAYVELTDLYSQKELRNLVNKIGTGAPNISNSMGYVPRYSIQYYPTSGTVVIDNQSMTNDTIEILKDGSVRHVGSWHNKVVAPEGSCSDIIKEVKSRMNSDKPSA